MLRGPWLNEKGMGAFGLVGILVAVAIGIALMVYIAPAYIGGGVSVAKTAPPGKAPTPIQRAESVECQSNLSQVRQAITMYQTNNEKLPASIQELSSFGVSGSLSYCPVGGANYTYAYDARTGRVGCRYPGHERY